MTDQLIGNYKVLQKIGAGGMAKVYLAVHKDVPNLRVILKILSDSRLVERFRQEADKLALLDGNPNICRIKHFFNHGDDIVIAMEYIDGVTVEERIKADGPLPVAESLRIIRDVLGVLDFAHAKGIHHRDIKPSNIMMDSAGNVKVIDFGIAKAESDPSLTIAGTACGTPAYMAPEQFTPSETTNNALVDIYAVGTTLYYMLTGEVPFKGDNEFAIRDAKLFTEPPSLKQKATGVSEQLDKLVMRSLQKDPIARFANTREMMDAVECIRCSAETAQPTTVTAAQRSPGKKLPRKALIGALAVVALALVVFFGIKMFGDSPLRAPVPAEPALDATLTSDQPTFRWQSTGAESYTLEFANNPDFFISELVENLSDTFYAVTIGLEDGRHFWRVKSVEGDQSGEFSGPQAFTVRIAKPSGRLEIAVVPSGDIYVDDELVASASTGTTVDLDAGQHQLRLINNRAVNKELSDEVTVVSDSTVAASYTFRMPSTDRTPPSSPPAAPTLGELVVGSRPTIGADIYIDGKLQDRKTPNTFKLRPGSHVVRAVLIRDGVRQERVDTVTISAGGDQRIIFDFEK